MSLGNLALTEGQPSKAIAFYTQATKTAPTTLLKTQSQLSHLRVLLDTENQAAALDLAQKLQPQVVSLAASRPALYVRIGLAQSLMKLVDIPSPTSTKQAKGIQQKPAKGLQQKPVNSSKGLLKKAAQLLATAAQQAEALSDQRAESFALGTLGQVYEKNQQIGAAQGLTQKALVLSQVSNAPDIAYRWQWQLGRLLTAQSQKSAAIAAYSEAVETLKQIRSDLVASNPDLQFTFRESVEPVYRELVSLLLSDADKTSQANLKKAREVIESLQIAELDNYFREACLTGQPTQVDRIDPNAAIIYPIVLSDRIEIVISLPNQTLRRYKSSISQAALDNLLSRTRQFLRRSALTKLQLKLAQDVYNLLIRPAEADLQTSGVKTLVFVLDGALRNIPMAVLHDGEKYLVEKYSIAFTPSLQLLSPKPLTGKQFKVLLGGLSEARLGFSSLPGVQAEVDKIKGEVPSQVLFNETFTVTGIQQQIESTSYPIVHLATHGQFSSNADETFILAWDNRVNVRQLGELLQARSETNQNPIELLVLSACQTAEGDRRATLGLAGVAVRSGARSTLATLWPVDDQATYLFMTRFYQEIVKPGATKAEALRQAQLFLMKEYSQPYFWAPFVLVGNWL
jgi:CHAT domain-containing protein